MRVARIVGRASTVTVSRQAGAGVVVGRYFCHENLRAPVGVVWVSCFVRHRRFRKGGRHTGVRDDAVGGSVRWMWCVLQARRGMGFTAVFCLLPLAPCFLGMSPLAPLLFCVCVVL